MSATKQQKTPKPAKPDKLARLHELAERLDDDGRQALIEAVEEHLREPREHEFKEPRSPITLSHTPPKLTPDEAQAMRACMAFLDDEESDDLHTRFCDVHEVCDTHVINRVNTWGKMLDVMRYLAGDAKLVEVKK